jgi:lysozyme
MNITPMVIDLSHWDPAYDYDAVKAAGIVGVIYKATEGQSYTDDTYVSQQHAAKAAGLKWGAYHFADGSSTQGQVDNFMRFANPDPDELFCLDWEDNPSGAGKMSAAGAEEWISEVEARLNRPLQCVIYSGNTAKEELDGTDEFFGARRLWLCQYGSSPSWQESWDKPWLWQYTDGVVGPQPHTIPGVGPCDINSYDDSPEKLRDTWASGDADIEPAPPRPDLPDNVSVLIAAPPGVIVKVRTIVLGAPRDTKRSRMNESAP